MSKTHELPLFQTRADWDCLYSLTDNIQQITPQKHVAIYEEALDHLLTQYSKFAEIQGHDACLHSLQVYAGQVDITSTISDETVSTWLQLFTDGTAPLYTFKPSPAGDVLVVPFGCHHLRSLGRCGNQTFELNTGHSPKIH